MYCLSLYVAFEALIGSWDRTPKAVLTAGGCASKLVPVVSCHDVSAHDGNHGISSPPSSRDRDDGQDDTHRFGVIIHGVSSRVTVDRLRDHLQRLLTRHLPRPSRDTAYRDPTELVVIEDIDIVPSRGVAFVHFGNALSMDTALKIKKFQIENDKMYLKQWRIPKPMDSEQYAPLRQARRPRKIAHDDGLDEHELADLHRFYSNELWKEYDGNLAVICWGIWAEMDSNLLTEHLKAHLKGVDGRTVDIEYIDMNHIKKFAFIYFANQQSLDMALASPMFEIEGSQLRMKRKRNQSNNTESSAGSLSREMQHRIQEYLREHPEVPPMERLSAFYDDIPLIAQRMSFRRFRVFLMDECHSFLRLEPPSSSRRGGWSVVTDLEFAMPNKGVLSEEECRALRFNDQLAHCIALNQVYGLRLNEMVNVFERETGTRYPADIRLLDHLRVLMDLKMVTAQESSGGNHRYTVPLYIATGILMKRILAQCPEGLPFGELKEKWKWFEQEDRVRRSAMEMDGEGMVATERKRKKRRSSKMVQRVVHDVDYVMTRFYHCFNVRMDAASNVMLFPKMDREMMAQRRAMNVNGAIPGFEVMQIEDKLDLVLAEGGEENDGMNLCQFIQRYEERIGSQLPVMEQGIFHFLARYKIHYKMASPVVLSRVYPRDFRQKLCRVLSAYPDGVGDDELDAVWKEVHREDLYVEERDGEYHRALVLFDKYYDVLRVSVDAATDSIRYHLRDIGNNNVASTQDLETASQTIEGALNWRELIRDTVRQYSLENDGAKLPVLHFANYFERVHRLPLPSTRSLVRVLAKCGVNFHSNDSHNNGNNIEKIVCTLESADNQPTPR